MLVRSLRDRTTLMVSFLFPIFLLSMPCPWPTVDIDQIVVVVVDDNVTVTTLVGLGVPPAQVVHRP